MMNRKSLCLLFLISGCDCLCSRSAPKTIEPQIVSVGDVYKYNDGDRIHHCHNFVPIGLELNQVYQVCFQGKLINGQLVEANTVVKAFNR